MRITAHYFTNDKGLNELYYMAQARDKAGKLHIAEGTTRSIAWAGCYTMLKEAQEEFVR